MLHACLKASNVSPAGGYTGFTVARDLLRMDFTPAKEDSDTDSVKAEIEAPAAVPPALGLTPDQLRKARRHRRKYGLAQPRPNSPKPKRLSPQKNSKAGIDCTILLAMQCMVQ